MPRYIDAEKLFNWGDHKLSDAVKYGNKDEKQQHWSYSIMMMYEIADEINAAPTADVAEVKRGEWAYDNQRGCYCSSCNEVVTKNLDADLWSAYNPPFCPNCGALMKGK
jgi:hypothetical protein